MERALAVPGEDDRRAVGLRGEEHVERREHVAIGEVERLGRVLALEQEGAERGLAIARRPDVGQRR